MRTYEWQHGRQLDTLTRNGITWTYTYDADGMRTSRYSDTKAYYYVYNGDKLSQMTIEDKTTGTKQVVDFTYDANGTPLTLTYDGDTYYYLVNLQGDVMGLNDSDGNPAIKYLYDSYGAGYYVNNTSDMTSTLAQINPLGYRSYVMDTGTALYFLQSRYYNPELGRFINADGYTTTGQGLLGNNMFAYCENNPINRIDPTGHCYYNANGVWCHDNWEYLGGYQRQPDPRNYEEQVIDGVYSVYKGVPVKTSPLMGSGGMSYGKIYLGDKISSNEHGVNTLKHEYGHVLQLEAIGYVDYTLSVFIPSLICAGLYNAGNEFIMENYYSLPWDYEADIRGNVCRGELYAPYATEAYWYYRFFVRLFLTGDVDSDIASRLDS